MAGKTLRRAAYERRECEGSLREGRSTALIRVSCERFGLTRNCRRCLSDSGVNSADMGMTSPARIMIALTMRNRQNRHAYFSRVTVCSSSSFSSSEWRLTCCPLRLQHRAFQASRRPPGQCSLLRCCRLPFPFLFAYPEHRQHVSFRSPMTQQLGIHKRHQEV